MKKFLLLMVQGFIPPPYWRVKMHMWWIAFVKHLPQILQGLCFGLAVMSALFCLLHMCDLFLELIVDTRINWMRYHVAWIGVYLFSYAFFRALFITLLDKWE